MANNSDLDANTQSRDGEKSGWRLALKQSARQTGNLAIEL
jgi:hypothetical protein